MIIWRRSLNAIWPTPSGDLAPNPERALTRLNPKTLRSDAFVIAEDFIDCVPGAGDDYWVAVQVVRERNQSDGQCQPRPRAQVALSTVSAARNTCRLSPVKSVHAIIKSQAGSPTPSPPKSMTALSGPRSTSRFPDWRSP